jgi:hypothetical protein
MWQATLPSRSGARDDQILGGVMWKVGGAAFKVRRSALIREQIRQHYSMCDSDVCAPDAAGQELVVSIYGRINLARASLRQC